MDGGDKEQFSFFLANLALKQQCEHNVLFVFVTSHTYCKNASINYFIELDMSAENPSYVELAFLQYKLDNICLYTKKADV